MLGLERLKMDGRREEGLIGVCGSGCLEAWARLLALLWLLLSFARQYSSFPSTGPLGISGGGDDRNSRLSHDAAARKSSTVRPLEAALGRDFDLDVAESLPMLECLLLLFSFSPLVTVSDRFLGTTGAGEGLPGGESKVSLSARSGWRSSAVRGRLCLCERRL